MKQTVLILGATSAMAEHTARHFAAQGATLLLAARNTTRLDDLANDLRLRGAADVKTLPPFDAAKPHTLPQIVTQAFAAASPIHTILIAYGSLPEQSACAESFEVAEAQLQINFNSVVTLATLLANQLERQAQPATLGVISSVAGLRGRQSNYLYGAAKGGLHIFLQGLRNRLHPHNIRVVTFLPGFVESPMTAHLPQGPLFCPAEKAGRRIHKALTRGRGDIVYVPGFWRYIMMIIRAVPEALFKRQTKL